MFLTDFRSIRPRYESSQESTLSWLAQAHAAADPDIDLEKIRKLLSRYGCGPEKIARRGHELGDFLHSDWDEMRIYDLHAAPAGRGMRERTDFFGRSVDRIFEEFYPEGALPPKDILHVTCTGYASPSPAQKLVSLRNWSAAGTEVTHLYHMGCYAALPAIRVAEGFVTGNRRSRSVDIVHTELCTLHLNPAIHAPEQLVVQTLFSDGFIRYTAAPVAANQSALQLLSLREEIIPGTAEAMQWICSDWGMEMVLAKDVPSSIATALKPYLSELLRSADIPYPEIARNAIFAVHPGGPKIIDGVQNLLELSDWQLRASRETLLAFGNMSSATLPHIWKSIVEDSSVCSGAPVVSLAFGPGLTISGALLKKYQA